MPAPMAQQRSSSAGMCKIRRELERRRKLTVLAKGGIAKKSFAPHPPPPPRRSAPIPPAPAAGAATKKPSGLIPHTTAGGAASKKPSAAGPPRSSSAPFVGKKGKTVRVRTRVGSLPTGQRLVLWLSAVVFSAAEEVPRDPPVSQRAMLYDVANALRYCPDCHRATTLALHHASGGTACGECGLVLGERYVDVSSEWRTFINAEDDGGRDHFLAGAELGTTIAYSSPDPPPQKVQQAKATADHAEGAGLMPKMRGTVGAGVTIPRMRGAVGGGAGVAPTMRGAAGSPPADKALVDAFHSIDGMADRLGLSPAVKGRAREVIKKLEEAKAFPKGGKCRNRDALYAACLHVACRAEGTPRTFKELASVTGDSATAGIKDIGRLVKHIRKHLGEEDGQAAAVNMGLGAVVRAGDYLRRFGSLLGMGSQDVHAAQEAARRLESGLDVRRNPDSIAAAVVYMAIQRAGAKKSIRDVSTATGVSEVTIRDVYHKELYPHAELLFGYVGSSS